MFIVSMTYVFSHCILDLYSSPHEVEFVKGLELECQPARSSFGNLSSRTAVDSLHRLDSTIRESMRLSGVAVTALACDVAVDQLDLGNGIHIPRGVRIVYPTYRIHRDPSNYYEPDCFDAFRFHRPKIDSSGVKQDFLTTITPSWLVFGYGVHVCPGWWFAAQTLKQALANVVLDDDARVVKRRKERQVMLNIMVPDTETQIEVRREA